MFKNMKIRAQLLVVLGTVSFLTLSIITVITYLISRNMMLNTLDNNLNVTRSMALNTIETTIDSAARNYLRAKAESFYDVVAREYDDYMQALELAMEDMDAPVPSEDEYKERLLDIFSQEVLGRSGYYYIIDSDGNYIMSKNRSRDGENILNSADDDGNEFIKEIISKSKKLIPNSPNGVGFQYYNWRNPGDEEPRMKVAAFAYFEEWDWIVAASAYSDEFNYFVKIDDFRENFLKMKIGASGHFFIMDGRGDLILHPTHQGENMIYSPDKNDFNFASHMLQNKRGTISYFWQESEDSKPRKLVVSYDHFADLDWIVATAAFEDELLKPLGFLTNISAAIGLIGLLMMIAAIFYVTEEVNKGFVMISKKLSNIASGSEKADLTKRLYMQKKDEIGDVGRIINNLLDKLNKDIYNVANSKDKLMSNSNSAIDVMEGTVTKTSNEIKKNITHIEQQTENSTSGIEQLSSTLEEMVRSIDSILNLMQRQASSVERAASAIEEMVRNIENVTHTASRSREISNELNQVANQGGESVKNATTSIKEVSEYSKQILKMLQLITSIAKQTNLLAMNAAIEAAHAGEAGKGFAIVADEIRRLSEDTNKNAKDISDVVNSIVARIEQSVNLSEEAGEGLDKILSYSVDNQDIVEQLSVTMEEQNHGAKDVLNTTQELVQITEDVRNAMEQQKSATGDFNEALKNIRDLAIDNKNSIQDHLNTFENLLGAINQMKSVTVSTSKVTEELNSLVDRFVISEPDSKKDESDKTAMKLVE